MDTKSMTPILFPYEPEEFWSQMRGIIRDEVSKNQGLQKGASDNIMEIPGLTDKPLYKMQEICSLFKITKPTVYDWIKHGKLKRVKIRSRVYFLGSDIRELMQM